METPWAHETFDESWRSARRQTGENFAGHQVVQVAPFEWHCKQPGSDTPVFRVLIRAGFVILFGAQGQGVFVGGEAQGTPEYTLEWLGEASSKGDYPLSYLVGKLRPQLAKEFYPGDALEWAQEYTGQCAEQLFEGALCAYDNGEFNREAWQSLLHSYAPRSDGWEAGMATAHEAVWLTEVLRWFCLNLPQQTVEVVA